MKLIISKVEEENRKLSKVIESAINDPKNYIDKLGFNNNENSNDQKDFSKTFFNKENKDTIDKDEKNTTGSIFSKTASNAFNGGSASKTSNDLPNINIGNMIKLKEVNKTKH